MTRPAFFIVAVPVRPRVCAAGEGFKAFKATDLAAPPGSPPAEVADAAAAALAALGYAGGGVMLALPSAWCLCAAIRLDDLPARNNRQAMTYRLEEKLPLSAEDVVADFLPIAGAAALGVCVDKRTLAPLVQALESRGVAVEAVCPASLLAFQ